MIVSRFIHAAANGIASFLFMTESYSIAYVYHIFFIHSSVNEHLGCFHVLATINSAAVYILTWTLYPHPSLLHQEISVHLKNMHNLKLQTVLLFSGHTEDLSPRDSLSDGSEGLFGRDKEASYFKLEF